jgi:hypothetical protein
MEAILALILAGTIARTSGLWALTRWGVVAVCLYAILFDFTPLRRALTPASPWVWLVMLVLWGTNIIRSRTAA